jgi:hypothetical protein
MKKILDKLLDLWSILSPNLYLGGGEEDEERNDR